MKGIIKGEAPPLLTTYRDDHPDGKWESCSRGKARRKQIQQYLLRDQGGLCAYCEIDLKPTDDDGLADLRVEHFHPKSDDTTAHNWHLDWQNLLACCHGGSNSNVTDSSNRATSPDHSCDVPKADNNWDDLILNPLEITSTNPLFNYSRATGQISVSNNAGEAATKAQNSIDLLRLDANRLKRLRKAELDRVNDQLRVLLGGDMELSQASALLAKVLIKKDVNGNLPKFVSALRYYLRAVAQQ